MLEYIQDDKIAALQVPMELVPTHLVACFYRHHLYVVACQTSYVAEGACAGSIEQRV